MTDTRILKNPLFEDLSGREIDELMNCVGARCSVFCCRAAFR